MNSPLIPLRPDDPGLPPSYICRTQADRPTGTACTLLAIATLLTCSCSNSILFATRTSAGLEVTGDIAKVPDHINVGYRRRELAYVGTNVPKTSSVIGHLDSQTTWNGGAAIVESFATGSAADRIASGGEEITNASKVDPSKQRPLAFASRTRIGLGYNLGGADDDAIPSLYFGYNRRIATRMDIDPNISGADIPTVLADTKVHSSGVLGRADAPAPNGEFSLSSGADTQGGQAVNTSGGIRIANLFAIGSGADEYLKDAETATALKQAMTKQPDENEAQ